MAKGKRVRTRKIGTSVVGLKEVISLLDDIGDAAAEVVNDAAKAGAGVVLDAAKNYVPVRSGDLKASLEVKKTNVRSKKYARTYNPVAVYTVGPKYAKMGGKGGVNYGHLVELGHMAGKESHVPAKPYLRPAVDKNKQRIANVMTIVFNRAIRAVR